MKISLSRALADAAADVQKSVDAGVGPGQFSPGGYSFAGGQPVQVDWDQDRAIRDGFKACSWVFACLDRLGGACSSVPWRVMEKSGRGSEWEAQDGHPLELAIEYPNEQMSRQFLINLMVQYLGCGGNGLMKVVGVTRKNEVIPDELWPISSSRYRPVPVDEDAPIKFRNGRQVVWIEGYKRIDRPYKDMLFPEQVIHAQFPDPSNPVWGMSPMRSIARVIDMDVKQVAWNSVIPDNHMVPSGAFVDRALRTDGQLDEAARKLAERYGSPDRAHLPLVLGAGTDWLRMSLTPQEMDWIESRRFTMLEICAAFGLVPSLFVPDAKYANQDSAIKYMWKNGAHRFLSVLEDAFNMRFVPRARRGQLYIHFDLSVIPDIQDTLPARLEAHERAVRSGIPPNRSFILLDIPVDPVEGGDVPLVLGTYVPLGQLVAPPEPRPVPDPEDGVPGQGDQGAGDQKQDGTEPTPEQAPEDAANQPG